MKKILERRTILHHTVNTEYQSYKKKIPIKHQARDRRELRLILKTICKVIATELIERKAGVQIRKLGYFFIWKIPRKMYTWLMTKEGLKEIYSYHTDNYQFTPVFLPSIRGHKELKRWRMDNSFCKQFKKDLGKKIRKGMTYKMYPYSIGIKNN